MLKVYGTKICPDCIACEASFKKYGIGYEFVNIFATMPDFKEFLRLRDASPAFAHAKEQGSAGIPACVNAATISLSFRPSMRPWLMQRRSLL